MDPHYPDGFALNDGTLSNGLIQYDDFVAQEITETYEFLQELSLEKAKEILERPAAPQFKCDFPGCGFETVTKIALMGHSRKHKNDIDAAGKPVVEPNLIPIAGGRKVETLADAQEMRDNISNGNIPNGPDLDGVSWYGEGVVKENREVPESFGGMRRPGVAHFQG